MAEDAFAHETPLDGLEEMPSVPASVGGLPVGLSARQIRTSYVTAMSVPLPRDPRAVEARFLTECAQMGAEAYYSWEVDTKQGPEVIEGPSVILALAAARCFGNCAVEPLEVQETETAYFFRYAFIDLETGFTLVRPFRQSRAWTVYGRMDEERKEDIRFQIGASKATRNVIVNALRSLVNKGLARAKAGERARVEQYIAKHGLEAAQTVILQMLVQVGVPEDRVLARLRRPTAQALDLDDIVRLRGDYKAIESGSELAETLFPPLNPEAPAAAPPNGRGATEQAKQTVRQRREARGAESRQGRGAKAPAESAPENPSGDDPDWLALREQAQQVGLSDEEWQALRATDNLGAAKATVAGRQRPPLEG